MKRNRHTVFAIDGVRQRNAVDQRFPKGFVIRRVNNSGDISWHKGRVFVSQVLRFEDLGFELVAEDFYKGLTAYLTAMGRSITTTALAHLLAPGSTITSPPM